MSLAGAAGSTVGAIIIYYISRKISRVTILKLGNHIGIGEKELEKAEKWFDKHGSVAIFLVEWHQESGSMMLIIIGI